MRFSPLFWPIQLRNNMIYILDETALPHTLVYIKAGNYTQACKAIRDMKTRAVGQVILVFYIFLQVIGKQKNQRNLLPLLEKVAAAINTTRPTLAFQSLTDMVLGWARSGAPLEKNILGFLGMLREKRIRQAQEAAQLIRDGDVILTHCNVSGAMPLIGEFCRREGKKVGFFVTETRPYLQGSRLTAWELKRADFPVTVISDNMAAFVMSKGMIHTVMVGADHLALNGDIANKIGTYQLAIVADYFHIPFYVLCPPPSGAKTGGDIRIEIRPDTELLEYQGVRLAPRGVRGYYPAFDVTPNALITKHIYLEMGT